MGSDETTSLVVVAGEKTVTEVATVEDATDEGRKSELFDMHEQNGCR